MKDRTATRAAWCGRTAPECDVDGCSSAVALAVRDGVLVKVVMLTGDLDDAALVLQAQLDRLEQL